MSHSSPKSDSSSLRSPENYCPHNYQGRLAAYGLQEEEVIHKRTVHTLDFPADTLSKIQKQKDADGEPPHSWLTRELQHNADVEKHMADSIKEVRAAAPDSARPASPAAAAAPPAPA